MEELQHIADFHAVLVGGFDVVCGNAGLKDDGTIVNAAQNDVAVSDIDGQEHPFHLLNYGSTP